MPLLSLIRKAAILVAPVTSFIEVVSKVIGENAESTAKTFSMLLLYAVKGQQVKANAHSIQFNNFFFIMKNSFVII